MAQKRAGGGIPLELFIHLIDIFGFKRNPSTISWLRSIEYDDHSLSRSLAVRVRVCELRASLAGWDGDDFGHGGCGGGDGRAEPPPPLAGASELSGCQRALGER